MNIEQERRTLMRRIWALNLKRNWSSIRSSPTPWLLQHHVREVGTETDAYGYRKLETLEISFPERRTVHELPFWERVQRFRQAAHYLYHAACRARDKADSWRNFHVGCAALAFKPYASTSQAWDVFIGMNMKPARNVRPVCAEPIAIASADAKNFGLIVGIVVVGELREEDVITGLKTLHPCQDCRWLMSEHRIVDECTLVLTAKPPESGGFDAKEVRTVRKLLRLHERISGDDFN